MRGKNKKTWTLDNLEIRMQTRDDGTGQTVEQPVIQGYAAVYNSESDLLYGFFREVIRPGAFDSSLKNDIRALWNHNASYVLGRSTAGTLDVRSDAKGLYFEVTPPDTQWAKDLCESIRRKDINQMSFGFITNEDNWQSLEDGTELRELLDVDLQEVSVVTFPAYQATSAGMRSIEQEDEEVKKRIEERENEGEKEPEKRFTDYLKMLAALDFRAAAKADPGSEADDPDDEDDLDDDDGDEEGQDNLDDEPKEKKTKK